MRRRRDEISTVLRREQQERFPATAVRAVDAVRMAVRVACQSRAVSYGVDEDAIRMMRRGLKLESLPTETILTGEQSSAFRLGAETPVVCDRRNEEARPEAGYFEEVIHRMMMLLIAILRTALPLFQLSKDDEGGRNLCMVTKNRENET